MVVRHLNTGTVHSDDYHPCQECDEARAVANLGRLLDEGDLGRAWAEAEAALPEGWAMDAVSQTRGLGGDYHPGGEFLGEWIASAQHNMRGGRWARENAQGPTPAAALRALAAKLREREG